jgi:NitT/TauT family transport system substrate-binding protein
MNIRRYLRATLAACWIAALLLGADSALADEYFDRYGLAPASPALDLGVQPLGYPSGVISAVMRRDRILQKALSDSRHPLAAHPFRRGADMIALLADHRLEAGLLGDMPTILAAATGNVWIVGLVKQTATAIVAKGNVQIGDLAGKRIGYVDSSSAHHTLLQGLNSAGLADAQVKLVSLRIDEMPEALERGEIDAFAAWEPAPAIALGNSNKNRIVFRGLSADYFVIDRDFVKRDPEAARQLVAGFLRAVEWMRRSQQNAEKAARWVLADGAAFSGKPPQVTVPQIVAILRREILNVPSAPAIINNPETPALKGEFEFLTRLGKLPAGGKWEHVAAAFAYDGLAQVMAEPRKFRTGAFDYEE